MANLDHSDGKELDCTLVNNRGGGGSSTSLSSLGFTGPVSTELTVPMSYNTYLHKVSPAQRIQFGLSTDLVEPLDYCKFELALLSGLPNEVDFALNAALLLSYQPGKFDLRYNSRLINLLAAQVGIFDCGM